MVTVVLQAGASAPCRQATLTDELRRARDDAGYRQADVAHSMDWSPSKLIRIERGDVGVSTNDLKALLSHYGVKDKG